MTSFFAWLMTRPGRWTLFAVTAGVVLIFDQVTKFWALGALTHAFDSVGGEVGFGDKIERFLWLRHPLTARSVEVLESFWRFRYAENPGSAWSFLAGAPGWFRTPFLLAVSLAAMVFILVYYRRTPAEQNLVRVALALIFGGALGNLFDRARLGYVIDFIDWHWYDKATWPTFNVADAAISVGVGLMLLDWVLTLRGGREALDARGRMKAKGG